MRSVVAQRRNPRQTRAKITVDAILAAATRVFTTRGFARASTNAIAEQAGVSVGSLYQYFPDKHAILSALHERHLEALMSAMTHACRTTTRAGLRPTLEATIAAAAKHHRAHAPLVREFARNLPHDDALPRAATREFQSALRELLAANRRELRIADLDRALFMLRTFGRSLLQAAAEARPQDLENGVIARELLTSTMTFLTGMPPTARPADRAQRRGKR